MGRTVVPSLFSIMNLCCNMTIYDAKEVLASYREEEQNETVERTSRSPFSYCIFSSRVAQSVSSRLPRGVTFSDPKRPTQRRPEMIRCSSAAEGKVARTLTRSRIELLTNRSQHTSSREKGKGVNVRLGRVLGTKSLRGNLVPGEVLGDGGGEPLLGGLIKEPELNEGLDEGGESLVAKSAADDGLGLGDEVLLPEGRRVAVGVGDEGLRALEQVEVSS